MKPASPPLRTHAVHVYQDTAIRVFSGANQGDAVGDASSVELGDVYRLDPSAASYRLVLSAAIDDKTQRLAPGSDIGKPGDRLDLRCLLTMMAPDGDRIDVLVVCHGASQAILAIPLSPMVPRTDYTLLAAQSDIGTIRLADVVCVSFAAGTLVTTPDGAQRAIEGLKSGDVVLTRDNGGQPVRWVGKATLRANGAFAPVVISAGTLGNLGDLVVSPHHRVFIYQRGARRLTKTAELLVQAKHLVDGETVFRREGGFVDYYSLVFDRHEIIYAEGIPAESLMVNDVTMSLLPEELAQEIRDRFPGLSQHQHFGTEAGRDVLDNASRDALFRRDKDRP